MAQAKAEWNSSKTISCSKLPERNKMELVSKIIDNIISKKYFSGKNQLRRYNEKCLSWKYRSTTVTD